MLSSSCLLRLHLSLFSISDPTLTLVSPPPPPPPLSMSSPQCFMVRNSSTETSRHGMSGRSPLCFAVSILLSIRVLSSSCLLRLSLFSIFDPTLTLVSHPPPPLSMSSPSSVFYGAEQFNGDLSAWDVGSVTDMQRSECTTVHPRVVSSSCLLSRLHLSLSLPFLIPHTHLSSSSSSSSLDVLPLHHQCFLMLSLIHI